MMLAAGGVLDAGYFSPLVVCSSSSVSVTTVIMLLNFVFYNPSAFWEFFSYCRNINISDKANNHPGCWQVDLLRERVKT